MLRYLLPVIILCTVIGCATHRTDPNSPSEKGFLPIFNGKNLDGWVYGTTNDAPNKAGDGYQVDAEHKTVYCTAQDGGNLFTKKEYSDFVLRFEFQLTPNANNGIGIRAPLEGNAAYNGMEIQILDDNGSKYTHLRPAQYCCSIYDVFPAERGHLKTVGEWNQEEIIANGRRITVKLNGATVVDANLDDVKDPAILAKHRGLQSKSGHIGFLGHGAAVQFRNLRIKTLS